MHMAPLAPPSNSELKGTRSGSWAVSVSGNWHVTFRFDSKGAIDVDYEDYH